MASYMNPISMNSWSTPLTDNSSTAKEPLGSIRTVADQETGYKKQYIYVQAASDTTVANGTVLAYLASSTTDLPHLVVSSDRTDTCQYLPAGVGIGAITASYYGWIQTKGYHSAVKKTSTAIAVGTPLYVCDDAGEDGTCEALAVSGGTSTVIQAAAVRHNARIGVSAKAGSTTTVAAFLNINSFC